VSAVVEVRFKGNRLEYFNWSSAEPLALYDPVIVEVERGQDLGRVSALGDVAETKCVRGCGGCSLAEATRGVVHQVLRRANPEDTARADRLRAEEDEVRRNARDRVRAHALPMKVSDAEWQWDRRKLTLYFTADQRVDFRALVRDLASVFRTRIELRQIGARDEARRLSGIGRCGREYCSASWLPELRPVNLSVAKDQHLSLNPSQISGPCGRLLCCLHYEHEFYVQSRKRFPKEGKVVRTAEGEERVQAVDIFRERVTLRSEEGGTRVVSLVQLQGELAAAGGPPAPTPAVEPPAPTTAAPSSPSPETSSPPTQRRQRRRKRRRGRGERPGA
jgi:cell fate regulator YaaT (PSP1 superfamily)